ncbi:MAG: cell division protein FtsZ, partial [Microcystis aeruginosa]
MTSINEIVSIYPNPNSNDYASSAMSEDNHYSQNNTGVLLTHPHESQMTPREESRSNRIVPSNVAKIKVIGVGGGGCNAVNRMIA